MTHSRIELANLLSEGGCTTTAARKTIQKKQEKMSYILLVASGLRFTGILLKIQQEIVYTVTFKAT